MPVPPEGQRLRLRSADGVDLAGVHLPAAPGAADPGLAIVVAHGFAGSWRHERVMRVLTGLRRHGAVIAVDQRGHGGSGGLTTLGHREPLDVAAAVGWARDAGHPRIATIGFSMGASVVLRHAALVPGNGGSPDAVVSVSGPAYWYYRGTPPMRWLHRAVVNPLGRAYVRFGLGARVAPTPWPEPPPLPPVDAAARIREQAMPLLIVHGDADAFFPVDHPRALHRAAPGSQWWQVPGFGHAEGAIDADLVDRIGGWVVAAAGSRVPAAGPR